MQTLTWQSVMHSATFLAEYKWKETPDSLFVYDDLYNYSLGLT